MAIIINGRRIDPNSIGNGVRGSDLIAHARAGSGRRPIIESGGRVSQIDPNKRYSSSELVDKRGRGAKLTSMPDRSKGYGLTRSSESRQIITEQVYDVATHMFRQGSISTKRTPNGWWYPTILCRPLGRISPGQPRC